MPTLFPVSPAPRSKTLLRALACRLVPLRPQPIGRAAAMALSLTFLVSCGGGADAAEGATGGLWGRVLSLFGSGANLSAMELTADNAGGAHGGGGASPRMVLGAQTHFSQGWPINALEKADRVHAVLLRDSLPWKMGEPSRGSYDFSGGGARALSAACDAGHRLILTQVPENPLYDDGLTAYSETGKLAFAAYVNALIDHWGACIAAIEIGNEINNSKGLVFPEGVDPAEAYVALLKTLRTQVGAAHPDVALLGGSTNQIGTGFLEGLFAAGMLPLVDGVVVHPYTSHAGRLDFEIANLREVMARYGSEKPIWATEFSHDLADRSLSAGEHLKAITLMAAAGVDTAVWYALIDQKYFPRMGLFDGESINPAGKSFAYAQEHLVPLGRPRRIDLGDPLLFAYRYGADRWVVWGNGQTLTLPSGARALTPTGQPLAGGAPLTVSEQAMLVEGAPALTAAKGPVLADSMLQYGADPWQYFVKSADGAYHRLSLYDDRYTSQFASRWYKPLRIGMTSAAVAGDGSKPVRAVWRYVSPTAQRIVFAACLSKNVKGDGVDFRLTRNDQVVASGILESRETISTPPFDLAADDRLEFDVGPNQTFGGDSFSYRLLLARQQSESAVKCP